MIKKTIVIAGQQGERGDKAEEYSVPIDGVLGYTETGTPDGYVEAGYFKVTGLDEVDSRIDVIESLPEGSTSGDAEVADIRVGVDGEIYDSAGIAVRDQITELHDYAESIDDVQDAQIDTLKVTKAVEGEYITLNDAAALPANEYALTLSPVQSLNGYDSPWVGGGGKNLFDGSQINAWNNSNGLTITKNNDGSFVLNGKATATAYQTIPIHLPVGTYVLSGCPSGGSDTGYSIFMGSPINKYDTGDGVEFTVSEEADYNVIIPRVINGTVCDNLFIKPMICLSSAANPTTFAPYANICPIHGADEVGVRVCGKNLLEVTASTTTINGVTFTVNADGTVKVTGTATGTAVFQLLGGYNPDSYTELTNFGLNYNTNYSLNGCPSGGSNSTYRFILRSGGSAGNKVDTGNGVDFNIASDDTTLKWMPCIVISSGYAVPSGGLLFKPMIRYATVTDSTFEPYTLHSTTITLPSTVYGGSVEQGGSGKSNKYSYVLTGTETTIYKHNTIPSVFGINMDDVITSLGGVVGDSATLVYRGKNSMFIPQSYRAAADMLDHTTDSYTGGFGDSGRTGVWFRIKESTFADLTVEQFKAKLAEYYAAGTPLQYVFDVVPTSLSVTPFPQTLLEGVNNVWAECSEDGAVIGDAEQDLTYQRDTTLVIQNLINRIVELERRN